MKPGTQTGRPVEILLIEDSAADAELTLEAMRTAKVRNELHLVSDGEEAMAFLRRVGKWRDAPRPDLILLDLNLPRKDGREVLAEVKSDAHLQMIPVVVLTTSAAEADILRTYEVHANAYVTKPVDFAALQTVVSSIENFWLEVVTLP